MSIEYIQEENLRKDISEARQFLTLLDEDSDRFVFETIQEPKPKDGLAQIRRHTGTFEALEQTLIDANQNGNGVFVTINETDGNGRKKENVTRVRSFFVDLDGSPLEPVLQSSLEPHIIVESSPGRYHAY